MKEYMKFRIYGTILPDGKFRIVDKLKQQKGSDKDKRLASSGTICIQMGKPEIIKEILLENTISKEINNTFLTITKRKDMIKALIGYKFASDKNTFETYSTESLEFILKIYVFGASRTYLCDFIKDRFKKEGKILYAD